jgi:hypothetical protein
VAIGIWDAPEHRQHEVAAYYQTLLGRSASADLLSTFWVNELEAGAGELLVVRGIMSSAEYQNQTAHNNTLYVQNPLGALGVTGTTTVTINGTSMDLLAEVNGGMLTRTQAVTDALLSDQSLQATVGSMYQAYFQRLVELIPGLQFWPGQMQTNGVEDVGANLLSSQEYFQRIQASL